ncbi:MAG TPA: hypothetical protein DEF51_02665 [Myxococcales bacterium]|nr:hypothetical protein [Myxococcales bacterium]
MDTHRTFCRICEALCGLEVDVEGGRVAAIRPDAAHVATEGFSCVKGLKQHRMYDSPDRLTRPRLKTSNGHREASWDEALAAVGDRVKRIRDAHGPDAIAMYVGTAAGFSILHPIFAQGFMHGVGSRSMYSSATQDCSNKFAVARQIYGHPFVQPFPDVERVECLIVVGANPVVSKWSFLQVPNPARKLKAIAARGRVFFVDPRKTESAKVAGEHVAIRPGTDVFLVLALLGLFADRGIEDARVAGLETLLELAREITPERAEAACGVSAQQIRALAADIDRANGVAFHQSVGVNQGPFGTLAYVALQALAYVTGNYDARGGSLFSPLGVHGARLARQVGLFTSQARSRIGDFPTVFDSLPGGVMADEILTEGPERVRALVVIAGDPIRSIPGSRRLEQAIASLDAVVALDFFESRTGQHADVILPATTFLERSDLALPGLPLQTVDLAQTTPAMIPRVGEARPEHEVLAQLSLAIDRPLFGSRLASRVLSEPGLADRAIPALTELAWKLFDRDPARRGHGVPIPTPKPETYLGRGPMTEDGRVHFWRPALDAERARLLAWEKRARPDGFVLLGRRRRIGHNSWLHGGTREGALEGEAWMAPSDLARLGLEDGADVTLRTETGELTMPVRARDGVAPGTVVVPHGELEVNVNELLPSGAAHIEPLSGMLHMTGVPVEVRPGVRVRPTSPEGARA